MHPICSFLNIVYKLTFALICHLFHIYFRLKRNLLSSRPSSTLYVSAVYGHHRVSVCYGRRPLFSCRRNRHHIITGPLLLIDIAEDKCTKLQITITH
jgi:hypothetical protein